MQRQILRPPLPSYADALLSEVLDRTGYELRVVEEEGIGYDSELRLAGHGRACHELAYVPEYRDFGLHFLVNSAFKVLRVWNASPKERLVPASDSGRGLSTYDQRELRRKLTWLPPREFDRLGTFLYRGITRQLTSMPMDIRVERDIAERFPEHGSAQRAYLSQQVRDLEPTFMAELRQVCPARLHASSTAMNVVLAEEAADLTGERPGTRFQKTPHRALGKRLRELLHAVEEPGYAGDRVLTDAWAEELGMRDCYEWVLLDEVR